MGISGPQYRYHFKGTDTKGQKPTVLNGYKAYRYHDTRTGTICTRSADLAAKSTSTAPKHPQRSPTARRDLDVNSVEIKDSSALCHQEIKLLISLVKIQDWRFLRLTEEQGFSTPKFDDWFEELYGSRSS
ncbi:hypothetical protein V6N13_091506 [Hibiscus sabdariffa]